MQIDISSAISCLCTAHRVYTYKPSYRCAPQKQQITTTGYRTNKIGLVRCDRCVQSQQSLAYIESESKDGLFFLPQRSSVRGERTFSAAFECNQTVTLQVHTHHVTQPTVTLITSPQCSQSPVIYFTCPVSPVLPEQCTLSLAKPFSVTKPLPPASNP